MGVLRCDYLPGELEPLLRASGFEGTVAVQAQQAAAETDWLLELAERHAFIRGVVGWVDLCAANVDAALERYAARPKLVGVRHIVHDEPDDDFLLRPDFRRGVGRLREHALVYDLLLFPKHLPRAVTLVAELPEQPFVLDHIAKPFIRDGVVSPWREDLRRLASFPERDLQAVGDGDGSPLEGMAAGGHASVSRRGARGLRAEPPDDRLRLAGVPARRRLRSHDERRGRLGEPALGRGARRPSWAATPPASTRSTPGAVAMSGGSMTAAVLHGARDVRVEDYPRPELAPGQVLLRGAARRHVRIGPPLLPARLLRRLRADAAVRAGARAVGRGRGRGRRRRRARSRPPRRRQPGPRLRRLRRLPRRASQPLPAHDHARQREHAAADGRRLRRARGGARRPVPRAARCARRRRGER
jgi:hypothetical protein